MSKRQMHRGRHPDDARLFRESQVPLLREAAADYSFLLTREYSEVSALKLVGDRFQLTVRQRSAVLRAACSDTAVDRRARHRVSLETLCGRPLIIDGYNLLIVTESILAGGILIRARDGCIRDMASIHGSYRTVAETLPAIRLLGETLERLSPSDVKWLFDAPVSNSGRLRTLMLEEAGRRGWSWQIELVNNVDPRLAAAPETVLTSDGWILDRAERWANAVDAVLAAAPTAPCVLALGQ